MVKIHRADQSTMQAEAKRLAKGKRYRVEIREVMHDGTEHEARVCGLYAVPEHRKRTDSDGWCRIGEAIVPRCPCYLDVQVAVWDGFGEFEPFDWFTPHFECGRLVRIGE